MKQIQSTEEQPEGKKWRNERKTEKKKKKNMNK